MERGAREVGEQQGEGRKQSLTGVVSVIRIILRKCLIIAASHIPV
jgi:hypothetical protein